RQQQSEHREYHTEQGRAEKQGNRKGGDAQEKGDDGAEVGPGPGRRLRGERKRRHGGGRWGGGCVGRGDDDELAAAGAPGPLAGLVILRGRQAAAVRAVEPNHGETPSVVEVHGRFRVPPASGSLLWRCPGGRGRWPPAGKRGFGKVHCRTAALRVKDPRSSGASSSWRAASGVALHRGRGAPCARKVKGVKGLASVGAVGSTVGGVSG